VFFESQVFLVNAWDNVESADVLFGDKSAMAPVTKRLGPIL
jgi:hypothetical protein